LDPFLSQISILAAIDMSPAQNALLQLKIIAISQFSQHSQFVELIGLKPSNRRYVIFYLYTGKKTESLGADPGFFMREGGGQGR
jgi:S-adenosylmethionine:diacylglycerol 3-amino-3-carboxypropyl transferase